MSLFMVALTACAASVIQSLLSFLFLVGFVTKYRSAESFLAAVKGYRLLPEWGTRPAAVLLAIAEGGTGLALLLGLFVKGLTAMAAIGAIALLALFTLAVAVNLLRGRRNIDCGCRLGRQGSGISWGHVGRNIILIGVAGVLLLPVAELPAFARFSGLFAGALFLMASSVFVRLTEDRRKFGLRSGRAAWNLR